MSEKSPLFNTKYLLPATGYYNKLMREIDDADWIGDSTTSALLEDLAREVKKNYVDKGELWYPDF